MAIADFATLKARIRTWLKEDDTDVLPDVVIEDWISFVESDLNANDKFRLVAMQRLQEAELSAEDPFIILPDGFLEMNFLTQRDKPQNAPLTYTSPESFVAQDPTVGGDLSFFTITKGQIRVGPAVEGGEVLRMGWYEEISRLSDANTSNWLLAKDDRVYLFGALSHAGSYHIDTGSVPVSYATLYERAVSGLIRADRKTRTTGATKQVGIPEPAV